MWCSELRHIINIFSRDRLGMMECKRTIYWFEQPLRAFSILDIPGDCGQELLWNCSVEGEIQKLPFLTPLGILLNHMSYALKLCIPRQVELSFFPDFSSDIAWPKFNAGDSQSHRPLQV